LAQRLCELLGCDRLVSKKNLPCAVDYQREGARRLARLGGRALACADVWLMRAPPGVLPGVWQVVCIAALRGMWVARGALMVPQRRERYAGRTDQQRVQLAERTAVEAFWGVLSDYIRLGQPPRAWRRRLPAGSPFLHYPSPAGGLQVNRR
jgi:hypothetical protein